VAGGGAFWQPPEVPVGPPNVLPDQHANEPMSALTVPGRDDYTRPGPSRPSPVPLRSDRPSSSRRMPPIVETGSRTSGAQRASDTMVQPASRV
jgi:hypothetical protein